ncbi:hypothetical protein FNYG_14082 [Fusarium nygamai]|uniref:Uncharacterized protein n=1 Tax=Gibberella nygamai TaxID=42673 RepID=A0A2K0UTS7_GIBNY|nr:hypothetical protein FNYG_14082 [Fusarium nygamai]
MESKACEGNTIQHFICLMLQKSSIRARNEKVRRLAEENLAALTNESNNSMLSENFKAVLKHKHKRVSFISRGNYSMINLCSLIVTKSRDPGQERLSKYELGSGDG